MLLMRRTSFLNNLISFPVIDLGSQSCERRYVPVLENLASCHIIVTRQSLWKTSQALDPAEAPKMDR